MTWIKILPAYNSETKFEFSISSYTILITQKKIMSVTYLTPKNIPAGIRCTEHDTDIQLEYISLH